MFIGIDTGGTFTDFLLLDDEGSLRLHKVLSTPSAPEQAIMQGISDLGIDTHNLQITHGSTVATNAILEGKGVKTIYITNRGLADVLTIGRQAREELYNLTPVKKPPLIPPEQCLEVDSRYGFKQGSGKQGEQLTALDVDKLNTLIDELKPLEPKAVAINLLFSFMDDSEEIKIEQALRNHFGSQHFNNNVFISRSSDVLPEYKEYERGMTTTLNAMVGPLMQGYLNRLQQKAEGCVLSIMQSSGGTASVEHAGRYPVHLLLSGPAGGLIGAKCVAAQSGFNRLLSFDMGGTSTDVSIIDKDIGFTTESKIGGYPVSVPMVDMHTIGAGGGSIASVDAGGMLLVGPESAGADPGPACYGKGGTQPTVTDANVVLGRLLPEAFLGGGMTLDKQASEKAVQTIADKLGITLFEAAKGIIDVVNDHMVRALRVMSVQRGEDPKDYTLVSFGGAGGLHVCALAEALGMNKALVPIHAGVLSALGMLAAEQSRERSLTVNKLVKDCERADLDQAFSHLLTQAKQELLESATDDLATSHSSLATVLSVDVRYKGQSHALNLQWTGLENIEHAFHQKHEQAYGHQMDIDIELVNLRVRVIEEGAQFSVPEWQHSEELDEQFTSMPSMDARIPVINRAGLHTNQTINGPALITETSSTTWLAQGWTATVDKVGSLALCRE
jgi:N-methylhydantoinase A